MSSVMKKLRNKRSKADKFQITASVSSLVLECQKEKWHPCKLAIVWNKENPKLSSTKPVLWQGGFKNPYSGIIVWPEPDLVKTKLTLFKNSEEELYQYQDKPWQILVQNVTPSGKRKVIAVGSLDISEYIMEEPTSHDITVTLKPVKKSVLSGSLEFSLSSVILEDGVPRRTDKEIFDEIMSDAITELERSKSLQKEKKSNGQGSKSNSQKTSGHKCQVSDTAACDSRGAASCSYSNIVGQRKVDIKSPFHPPPLHAVSQSATPPPHLPQLPPSSQPDCGVKEVKSFLSQTEERASNKKADNCPKELDTFGEELEESDVTQSSLASENASDLVKEIPVKDVEGGPVLKSTKPYVPDDLEESSKQRKGKDGHRSTPGEEPSCSDGFCSDKARSLSAVEVTPVQQEQRCAKTADLDPSAPSEAHSVSVAEASPSIMETPFNQEESDPCTTDPEASTPSKTSGLPTVVHSAVLEGSIVARETESSNLLQKNQRQGEDGLPISQHCPDLSVYLREETSLLQVEIASLEKVSTKLEMEIQATNKLKGCEEELEGLTQDWVSLNKCCAELVRRKRDLEILGRENNLEEYINGIRHELMFLFELEDWRKTDQHKAWERKLIDALVSLLERRTEIDNCPTGLKL